MSNQYFCCEFYLTRCAFIFRLCHQWGFEELEASICDYLQAALHVGNVCAILDTALAFGLDSLVNTCCVFADANAGTLLDHSSFLQLSPVNYLFVNLILLTLVSSFPISYFQKYNLTNFLVIVLFLPAWVNRTHFPRLILCR